MYVVHSIKKATGMGGLCCGRYWIRTSDPPDLSRDALNLGFVKQTTVLSFFWISRP